MATWDFDNLLEDVGSFLQNEGAQLLGAGASYLVNSQLQDKTNDAYATGAAESAGILKEGYDTQLGFLEQGYNQLSGLSEQARDEVGNELTRGTNVYDTSLKNNVADYGNYMVPALDQYGNIVMVAADQFESDMNSTAGTTADILSAGSEQFGDYYDPYIQAGSDAALYEQRVLGQDPSQLTPSQSRAMEEYRRNAISRLAASGLRGAGRAGVAAVNEGEAELSARMYDSNVNRSDNAARNLASRGFSSVQNVAANKQALANSIGDLAYKTGTMTAGNKQNTVRDVAGRGYTLAGDIGNKALTASNTAAQARMKLAGDKANLLGKYYGNQSDITSGRYQSRADTAMGKSVADASAVSAITGQKNQSNVASNNRTSTAVGTLANVLRNFGKYTDSSGSDTISGSTSNKTIQ